MAFDPELGELACLHMVMWFTAEETGPDYEGLARDTHPDGEAIWRAWWNRQTELCVSAKDYAHRALEMDPT